MDRNGRTELTKRCDLDPGFEFRSILYCSHRTSECGCQKLPVDGRALVALLPSGLSLNELRTVLSIEN